MLPRIARLSSQPSHRSRWSLVLFGLALLALPIWHQEAQSQFQGGTTPQKPATDPKSNDAKSTESKPSEGAASNAADLNFDETKTSGASNLGSGGVKVNRNSVKINRPPLPEMAAPSVEFLPETSIREKEICEALEGPTEIDFVDLPLDQALLSISQKNKINFVVDKAKLEEESISTERKDVNLRLSGISLRSALNLLLAPKGLIYFYEDEVLKVTTRSAIEAIKLTRTYPVRDLVGNVDAEYHLLSMAIQNSAGGEDEGSPWTELSGEGGTISALPGTGCLVIRHTRKVHAEVLELLRALRAANSEMQVKAVPRTVKGG